MSFIRSTLAAGADGARPHAHKTTTELFYILDGQLDPGELAARLARKVR